jgi:UDP-glucuronate 4-epimerase
MKKVIVTGAAGFIGFHVSHRLLALGWSVVGVDNLNAYYDPELKRARLARLANRAFRFVHADISDGAAMKAVFQDRPDLVVHLAAAAGVRHSYNHPEDYVGSNLVGFFQVLDGCRRSGCEHLVFASSSSVYGGHASWPSSASDPVGHPLSFYAATKVANEAMAHAWAHSYGVPCTGVRFFTVYGPWGRPDMALFSFTQNILRGQPITVYHGGDMQRDFTYIDDIVDGILALAQRAPSYQPNWDAAHPDGATSSAPWKLYNIGSHRPVNVLRMIELLEDALGVQAIKEFAPMPPGDVQITYADVAPLMHETGWRPRVPLEEGIPRFVSWYRDYFGLR